MLSRHVVFFVINFVYVFVFVIVFVSLLSYSHYLTSPSVASDLYGKLTYDDLDCQKKIICEFMDEPEMFG